MRDSKMDKNFEILLIEDNISDVDLLRESFIDKSISFNISVINDGLEVEKYLNRKEKYSSRKRPDLILLDLNLPGKNGFDILKNIKTSDKFKRIPVIVFSSSELDYDIQKCYNMHANAYIVKPSNLAGFKGVVKQIETFWFKTVELL